MDVAIKDESLLSHQPLVVGIGASAGGLEALQDFLINLPKDHDYAIVIIQHLDPDHDSLLQELLTKITTTPVQTATNGQPIEPGNIYLIAPGEELTMADGHLITEDFEKPRGRRRPIDQFFESMALDSGSNAVAIVLSGTGSDGAVGVRSVKEHGGLVFVQDPDQSKYDGMPRSAIDTGAHDLVLPVGEMVDVLQDYFRHMDGLTPTVLTDAEFIKRAMKHVRYRTGHDFQNYKPGTLLRRIAVRMSVLGITKPNTYLKELIESPTEASRLFRDMLINVTSFFRDPMVWDQVKQNVIPKIVEGRGRDEEVRVWVPGCATGQEAYTIAMLIADELERLDISPRVAIFGTDIDDEALRVARLGVYPNSIADEVPEDFLHKYFNWMPDGYEVAPHLRDMVRFSNQSLIKDPPFSRLDLVTCRNVLIYFDNVLQDTAMRVFQYALRDKGFLLLGGSENPSMMGQFFEEVSGQRRLFQRIPGPATRLNLMGMSPRQRPAVATTTEPSSSTEKPHIEALITDFTPPYLLLNQTGELHFSSPDASKYLQIKPGRPKLDASQMIRPELETILRRLLNKSTSRGEVIKLEFQGDIDDVLTRIEISRKLLPNGQQMIVFRDQLEPIADAEAAQHLIGPQLENAYLRELEVELDEARRTIRTTIEELETSNEELKSSNEEMMSMNEELQSANEELTTTNEELNNKITEVREVNGDLANFISSTQIATVFLNDQLNLRSFTPEAQTVFRFVPEDRGRRIDDIGTEINIDQLMADCREVSRTGKILETEYVTRDDERMFQARLLPYQADGEFTGGVVFTLVDVTVMRKLAREAERQAEMSRLRLNEIEEIYRASPQAMALVRPDLTYERVNERLAEMNGVRIEDHIHKRLDEIVPELTEQVNQPILQVLETGKPIERMRAEGSTRKTSGEDHIYEVDYYPVYDGQRISGVGINVRDITEQVNMQQELHRMMQELQHRVKNMLANVVTLVNRAERDATADIALFNGLSRRITSLAQTHKLLTQTNWSSASLHELAAPELTERFGEDRVMMKGPKIHVNARAALSLGITLHELASNAAAHGSLSNKTGKVMLSWVRQDDGEQDCYIFSWIETAGPKVVKPKSDGFGKQLIETTITGTLNGEIKFDWTKTGLRCEIKIPVAMLVDFPEVPIFDTLKA